MLNTRKHALVEPVHWWRRLACPASRSPLRMAPVAKAAVWREHRAFRHGAGAQQASVACQARPWCSTVASHLEPSFHGGTNHLLFYGLLQLFLLGFTSWFYFSFFLCDRPQEGENCWSQPITDLSLVFRGQRTLGCQVLQANTLQTNGCECARGVWGPHVALRLRS